MNTENVLSTAMGTVINAFEQTADRQHFKNAIVFGDESISYYDLNRRANKLARFLRVQGVNSDTPVGILMDQSINKMVALLAVFKAGAAYVPLEPSYPVNRIAFVLNDTGAPFLITNSHYTVLYDGTIQKISMDEKLQEELEPFQGTNLDAEILPAHLAYIIYTSGSTGAPKGVLTTHRNLWNFVSWFGKESGISPEDVTLQFASASFDASVMDLWIPLIYGATLHLYPNNKVLGSYLEDFINDYQITMLPFISGLALASLSHTKISAQLQKICFGGETLPDELINAWTDKVTLIQAFGPTEATVAVCSYICKKNVSARVIGKAGSNNILYVLDEAQKPVAPGITGELYIGGEQVAAGYLHNEAATNTNFIDDPFLIEIHQARGWTKLYKTGDLVTLSADGNLVFAGRKDEQVKIRGHRIEPGEIEAVINNIPGVKQGIVKAHEDRSGNKYLGAYIFFSDLVTSADAEARLQSARNLVNRQLPAYMVPLKWKWLPAIPMNASGKIDKKMLEPDEDPVIRISFDDLAADNYTMILTRIWSFFLQQPDFKPGDNFFEAGAHSLMLAEVYASLPENIRQWIKLPDFFIYQTPEKIAAAIHQHATAGQLTEKDKEQAIITELIQDATLDSTFAFNGAIDLSILASPGTIFLTGATGFVGSQLLSDLLQSTHADIYCLVRAKDADKGLSRLQQTFSKFLLPWPADQVHRIKVVPGDLSETSFNIAEADYTRLAEMIDVIYHSGSSVSYIEPYPVIKKANIDGLRGILTFAAQGKPKPLILLSSMGVFSWGRPFTHKTWMRETDNINENIRAVSKDLGYIRTKWVMEKMTQQAMENGLPVINFRLGFAVCNHKTGATALSQWWGSLVRACVEMGSFPLVMGLKDELTSVNYISEAVIHIARNPEAVGKNFHLSPKPENNVSLTDFFARMNEYYHLNLQGLPYKEWLELWKNNSNNPLYPLLSLFTDEVHDGRSLVESYEHTYYYTRNNTAAFLEGTGIQPPVFDQSVMTPYLQFMGVL